MAKVWLIIKREYWTRVRKPSFIIMTILGPLLIGFMYAALIWIALSEDRPPVVINVSDNSEARISHSLKKYNRDPKITFVWKHDNLQQAERNLSEGSYDAILYFPRDPVNNPGGIFLEFDNWPDMTTRQNVEWSCQQLVESYRLQAYDFDPEIYTRIRAPFRLKSIPILKKTDNETPPELKFAIGFTVGFLIYLFILIYGVQVLRGVMEEKTGRIAEIIVSSVRPFQLMSGKIIGIAMVGLTQFLIWAIFTGVIVSIVSAVLVGGSNPGTLQETMAQMNAGSMNQGMGDRPDLGILADLFSDASFSWLYVLLFSFLFYFLAGYLLYSSLFAAIGSIVDSDSDTQQFMLPVTLPLVFSIALAQVALKNPDGPVALFFSMFPLTSPIVMMVRIPFGVPYWQVGLSAVILILSFIGTTWLAGKIYRTGILMYGKKITYKELWKWLRYRVN